MTVAPDLERHDLDAWTQMLRADPTLVMWARDTVIAPPDQDRDLGRLADWAATVTERRTG